MKKGSPPKQVTVIVLLFASLLSTLLFSGKAASAQADMLQSGPFYYVSPRPGANYVAPATTIVLRSDQFAVAELLDDHSISAIGSESGAHTGELMLAGGETLIFRPLVSFVHGESVQVTVTLPNRALDGRASHNYTFAFTISKTAGKVQEPHHALENSTLSPLNLPQSPTEETIPPFNFLTAPPDLPAIAVEQLPGTVGDGYLFASFFDTDVLGGSASYLMIMDNNGEPVYYDRPLGLPVTVDFKKQPNGLLSYFAPGPGINRFFGLNNQYEVVDHFMAGNGYTTDLHDLQLLDNGHALLMIHNLQTVDMSGLFPGGSTEAPVIGCIIQEVDQDNNVVFEWRSWDHIDILDTNRPLDDNPLRYIHCNSVEQDHDGNILISSRHLDEVTKIDRRTGEIIWRLGGRGNEFNFTNDYAFTYQHDARRLANGHLTVYDNGVTHRPRHSRGIEYQVDETNKTVVKVAEYRNTPKTYALSMGNMQTLPNGNRIIGWGRSSAPFLTEFDSEGNKLLEFSTESPIGTYRAFRFPWQGYPTWSPVLATRLEDDVAQLHFSWNGSTETVSYKIFAGRRRNHLAYVNTVTRDGFETVYAHKLRREGFSYFQVIPVDSSNIDGPPSNIAHVVLGGEAAYLSFVAAP